MELGQGSGGEEAAGNPASSATISNNTLVSSAGINKPAMSQTELNNLELR